MEDNIWNKNVCLYGKTGVGNSTNSKRTKVGIDKTKGIHITKEVFKPTKHSMGL